MNNNIKKKMMNICQEYNTLISILKEVHNKNKKQINKKCKNNKNNKNKKQKERNSYKKVCKISTKWWLNIKQESSSYKKC